LLEKQEEKMEIRNDWTGGNEWGIIVQKGHAYQQWKSKGSAQEAEASFLFERLLISRMTM
jgi:hypothetical protein